jgi:tRNA threonylcarbamoyladenosine biosynthesis protein TsaB
VTALAIDTATESLGLCLESGGQRRTHVAEVGLRHSEGLLPAVQWLFEQAGIDPGRLDLVVCCTGPGSFTGIRIGLATARGLSFGAGAALIGVTNLEALAFRFRRFPGVVVPVLPALRRNYYAALFRHGERVGEYLALSLEELAALLRPHPRALLTGRGAAALFERVAAEAPQGAEPDPKPARRAGPPGPSQPGPSEPLPWQDPGGIILDLGSASTDPISLLELGVARWETSGGSMAAEDPQPLYLRKSDAEISRGL